MLSAYRSDIGAGVSTARDEWGQDQIYVVIETALQTRSGQQQAGALGFLTRLPGLVNGTTSINGTPVPLSDGQYIVPVIKNTARPDGDVLHQVHYGQTLWSLAIPYGTTIEQLQRWNNLGADTILYEKQLLLVQKGATQPVVIPTQTATIVLAKASFLIPSPTSSRADNPTSSAAPGVVRSSPIVVILIISVSLLIAGASVVLRVNKASGS
jgi:LysM repeat protein